MTDFESVLVYDGECPYCSVAARALRRLDGIGAVSWYDDAAQAFLAAQFGETPFAMVLVDRSTGTVYAGRAAANELADRAGLPSLATALVRENYERIADVVGTLSGRGRDPDPYHEVYDLAEGAVEAAGRLASAADPPPAAGIDAV